MQEGRPGPPAQVLVCTGLGCMSAGSQDVLKALKKEIRARGLDVAVTHTGCFGFCRMGPLAVVHPGGIFYTRLNAGHVPQLVRTHLAGGEPVEELLYRGPDGRAVLFMHDVPFFRRQTRVVMADAGLINPEDIEEYIARDGYLALAEALGSLAPEEVIDIVTRSGLRGRGGAGFPTGRKWAFAREAEAHPKYIVCNADEGDPGAFMDRAILEGNPHAVLEGMLIAGYAVGAGEGYIYVRAEYPLAVRRLEIAVRQARQAGLLGKSILGSDFGFDIDLCMGAGAFVCGEETALLRSAMGERGEPRPRPPFPAEAGLWGKPTVINNVETLANVPLILRRGWEWFAGIGTGRSKGTKIFSIAGQINNTGLVEVPMGTSLRTVVCDIGGGVPAGRRLKAVQTGGPSGGCIPAHLIDVPIDYESLAELGTIMGSGGLIVLDETNCMVDIARFYLAFAGEESCGQCTPCRIGVHRMVEILDRITGGRATESDLRELEDLARDIRETALCGLGQTAPNVVLSTLRYFRDEYLTHVRERRCPAGVCKPLLH
ncbi:MAG: NuoF family protein [Bacillota bacterium]